MTLHDSIEITSTLAQDQRAALEELLFFNANQHRVRNGIEHSIEAYGAPEILHMTARFGYGLAISAFRVCSRFPLRAAPWGWPFSCTSPTNVSSCCISAWRRVSIRGAKLHDIAQIDA